MSNTEGVCTFSVQAFKEIELKLIYRSIQKIVLKRVFISNTGKVCSACSLLELIESLLQLIELIP